MTFGRALYLAFVLLIMAFLVAPLGVIMWASFFADRILAFPPSGYTLSYYARAWQLQDFSQGFLMSIQVAVCATLGSLAVGVPAALAIERLKLPTRAAIREVLLAPMYVPAIVAGAAVYLYYIKVEIVTEFQLTATFLGLLGLLLAHTLVGIPWTLRLVSASLVSNGSQAEEAAQSLGANAFQTFFLVTLPVIRPGLIAAALFSFIASFTELELSLFLVGPGKTTLPIAIINYLEWNLDSTIAAVATVQIVIIGAALLVSDRFVNLGRAF
jgi:putative spermidine/putrescine transport system permease protein